MRGKTIIGIDPGTTITGFGVIRKNDNRILTSLRFGVVKTPSKIRSSKKLFKIYKDIFSLLKKVRPAEVALEKIFFLKNSKTALEVGESRGVILVAAEKLKIPVYEYTPLQVKQAVSSYGWASKSQVQKMVQLILGLKEVPRPDDAADALAIAICHANSKN